VVLRRFIHPSGHNVSDLQNNVKGRASGDIHVKKQKRKQTAAQKRARRERKEKFMMVFINGKQKRVPRPQLVEGLPVDEFIARNADPIWLHQNELWELMPPNDPPNDHV
jgi:hypothetical protein